MSEADRSLVAGIEAVVDSRNGVLAGRAAGMRVILVPNTSVPPGAGVAETADAVVERLADLPVAWLGAAA